MNTEQIANPKIPNWFHTPESAAEYVRQNPMQPVVENLINEHEVVGLHGAPESFKTIFCLQLADALANGGQFLAWKVTRPYRTLLFETEMSVASLSQRMQQMRIQKNGVVIANEEFLKQFRDAGDLFTKFEFLKKLIRYTEVEAVILDTANPFFRGKESPNEETSAGKFFDFFSALPVPFKMFVRHNRKGHPQFGRSQDDASEIRGSAQFAEVADLLLELRRTDKRTNEATLSVTKFRHGTKPDNLGVWFDAGISRLIAGEPLFYLLETSGARVTREELVAALQSRFGISRAKADSQIAQHEKLLVKYQMGHKRAYELAA